MVEALFKDWLILNVNVFSEKFVYNNQEFYSYYQISGFINPKLIGGTVSFKPVALIVRELNSENGEEYYLFLFDKSINYEEVIKQFVLEIIL